MTEPSSKKLASTSPSVSAVVDIYRLLVEMADRVSQRRQTANSFYLSINTLLVGASAYLSDEQTVLGNLLITVAGVAVCFLWLMNSWSYKTLNDAKFTVIQEVEKQLPIQPFASEWALLDPDKDGVRHRPFHKVERVVPWVFMVVYLVQGARLLPWERFLQLACG